jgi:hypothetical protein
MNITTDNFLLYFYGVLTIIALIGLYLAKYGKTIEGPKPRKAKK